MIKLRLNCLNLVLFLSVIIWIFWVVLVLKFIGKNVLVFLNLVVNLRVFLRVDKLFWFDLLSDINMFLYLIFLSLLICFLYGLSMLFVVFIVGWVGVIGNGLGLVFVMLLFLFVIGVGKFVLYLLMLFSLIK